MFLKHIDSWRWPPVLRALLGQGLAILLLSIIALLAARQGLVLPLPAWLFGVGLIAAGLVRPLGLGIWWLPIQFFFVPGLLLFQQLALPPEIFLAGFALLVLVFWNVFRGRVPLYLSGPAAQKTLLQLLATRHAGRFLDLGCGTGSLLRALADRRPDWSFTGVESSPLVFAWAWLRNHGGAGARMHWHNLWSVNLAEYDLVYCFLSPEPMPAIWRKACKEMRAGTLLVSNQFLVPGVAPDRTLPLGRGRGALYVWHIKNGAGGSANG